MINYRNIYVFYLADLKNRTFQIQEYAQIYNPPPFSNTNSLGKP